MVVGAEYSLETGDVDFFGTRSRRGIAAEKPSLAVVFNKRGTGKLPGYMGIVFTQVSPSGGLRSSPSRTSTWLPTASCMPAASWRWPTRACGYGCFANLPQGATGFTTIELKSNHLGTAREGTIASRATPVHLGKTTQVWDAVVSHKETGRTIALFRCTQLVIYPK